MPMVIVDVVIPGALAVSAAPPAVLPAGLLVGDAGAEVEPFELPQPAAASPTNAPTVIQR
jgi:hypothetical protein